MSDEAELCDALAAEVVISLNGARACPSAMATLIESEDAYIDYDSVLLLPGWERGIQLKEGSAGYEKAATAMRKQKPLPCVMHSAALQKAADRAALRMAENSGIEHVHPDGMTLLQSVRMFGKVSGLIAMNCSRGFFTTGNSVVISWIVHDGDEDRTHRDTLLREEVGYVGVGAAKGPDGRTYIAGVFADTCWDLDDQTDIIATLFAAYDENSDGALDHEEYSNLCSDLSIDFTNSKDDFTLLCEHANPASHSGGMTTEGLRSVAGDLLSGKADLINQLVSAKRAGQSVLKTSNHVCMDKLQDAAKGLPTSLKVDKTAVLERLMAEWRKKKGDILDEMMENYKTPVQGDAHLMVIAEIARKLLETKGSSYPSRNRIDLLNMALYTMAGPDIDAVMSFQGVPDYEEDNTAEWEEYKTTHKDRNGAMFGAINWAMRMAAGDASGTGEAWDTVTRWVKTICLLMAICEKTPSKVNGVLSRGLAALPQPVVDTHKALAATSEIDWGAPSSCATDPTVAENYVNGAAANATKGTGGSVLFTITQNVRGIPLQRISKYPKEAEVLLAPLSSFRVSYRGTKGSATSEIVSIEMGCCDEPAGREYDRTLEAFLNECLTESERAVPRLLKQTEQLEKTIPETLAEALKPAVSPYDAAFFLMRRKLRGMSHGGGPSLLKGGAWSSSAPEEVPKEPSPRSVSFDERPLGGSPKAGLRGLPHSERPVGGARSYDDTPVGGGKARPASYDDTPVGGSKRMTSSPRSSTVNISRPTQAARPVQNTRVRTTTPLRTSSLRTTLAKPSPKASKPSPKTSPGPSPKASKRVSLSTILYDDL